MEYTGEYGAFCIQLMRSFGASIKRALYSAQKTEVIDTGEYRAFYRWNILYIGSLDTTLPAISMWKYCALCMKTLGSFGIQTHCLIEYTLSVPLSLSLSFTPCRCLSPDGIYRRICGPFCTQHCLPLYCGEMLLWRNTGLFCRNIGLFCRHIGLIGDITLLAIIFRKITLCRNTGLFCRTLSSFVDMSRPLDTTLSALICHKYRAFLRKYI